MVTLDSRLESNEAEEEEGSMRGFQSERSIREHVRMPLSSECGTYKTVKA